MNINDLRILAARRNIKLEPAPWIITDPRIIDLDPSDWSEIPAYVAADALAKGDAQ